MNDTQKPVKKRVYKFVKIALVVVVTLGVVPSACVYYMDWSAQRKAKAFCDGIELGSDIGLAIAKAKNESILHGDEKWHTFYFPGTMFNKAVCEVSVSQDGKVISKSSTMEYD